MLVVTTLCPPLISALLIVWVENNDGNHIFVAVNNNSVAEYQNNTIFIAEMIISLQI